MRQSVRQEAAQTGRGGALSVEAVTKWFGTYRALDAVSLEIRSNEFFTLLGPSGCGKTTLLRMIAGFESSSEGRILLDGNPISSLPPYERPINTVFQSYALFPHMTVAANVGFGLKMQGRAEAEIADTVREMLRLVQLDHLAERKVAQLSGGQQQRVALARALAPRPKVLLLDEPLSALDLKLRQAMQIELKRLQRELGISFVFVTHDQEEALTMSDRIAVMSEGRLLQVGSPEDIYERPVNRFVADFIGETNFIEGTLDKTGSVFTTRTGAKLRVGKQGDADAGEATLAIRPEQLHLVKSAKQNTLPGAIESVVYFGTDSHVYVRCDGGLNLVVREQNSRGGVSALREGQPIHVEVPADTSRILKG